MQIKIQANIIAEALRVVSRLAPPASGCVNIATDGQKLWMSSDNETSRVKIILPTDEFKSKSMDFAVSVESLLGAVKGRKDLDVFYDKTVLNIKSGSYSIKLSTVDALNVEHDKEEFEGKPIKISAEQAAWLKSAVSVVALKPTAMITSTYMPLGIKFTEKGAFLACFDRAHLAFLKSKEIKGNLDITLPIDIVTGVLDVFNNTSFQIELGKANLHIRSKLMHVVLAAPQSDTEEVITMKDVAEQVKIANEEKGQEVEIEKQVVTEFMDNARAVCTKEIPELIMKYKDGKLVLSVATVNGSAKQVIPCKLKKPITVRLNYDYVDEAVRKSGSSVVAKLTEEFVVFKRTQGAIESTIIVAVNQDSGKEGKDE